MAKKKFVPYTPPKLEPQTENQRLYFDAIKKATVTICTGPPGTGKTFIPCGIAAEKLLAGEISRVIICRPLVSCGMNRIGLLPGELDEKIAPWMYPVLSAFEDFMEIEELKQFMKEKIIEMFPLELMRGANFRNSFIICDEAQNAEYDQLRMLLTRFSYDSKVILTGDPTQSDIKRFGENPLIEVCNRLRGHKEITHVKLGREDILRHPLIQFIDERLLGTKEPAEGNGECPKCGAKFTFSLRDHRDREILQTQCWKCKTLLWIPAYSEGETRFDVAEFRKDCQESLPR